MIKLPMESLDLYLKIVQDTSVYKQPCVLKEKEAKLNQTLKIYSILLHLKCSKYKSEKEIFFF